MALRSASRELRDVALRLSHSLLRLGTAEQGLVQNLSTNTGSGAPVSRIQSSLRLTWYRNPCTIRHQQLISHAPFCTQSSNPSPLDREAASGTQTNDVNNATSKGGPSDGTTKDGPQSQDSEGHSFKEEKFETTLLDAALKHVESEGWSSKALQNAARDLNLSPMFGGVCTEKDLVVHFVRTCNNRLIEKLEVAGAEFHEKSVPEKIKLAVRWRLEMLSPYINTWPQAMALLARPENMRTALTQMVTLMLGILNQVEPGSKDNDVVRYSKLFALQAVYVSSELYMLTDFSSGYQDTWDALDRRVDDFLSLSMGARQIERSLMETFNKMKTFGKP